MHIYYKRIHIYIYIYIYIYIHTYIYANTLYDLSPRSGMIGIVEADPIKAAVCLCVICVLLLFACVSMLCLCVLLFV